MAEEVEQQEALHLESDVRIDDDAQPVEDPGARRLEVPIFDREPVFDDTRRHRGPHPNQIVGRHVTDARTRDFVTGDWGAGIGAQRFDPRLRVTISKKLRSSRLAPPTSAPSTSGSAARSRMLSGLTLPP